MEHNSTIPKVENISRRNVIIGAAAAATSLLARNSFASSHEGMEQGHSHGHKENGSMHSGHKMADMALIDAANSCLKHGEICMDHCIELVKAGDTSIAACLASVSEMLASCAAISKLAAYQSVHLPAFAKACIAVCEDCEKECRRHEDKHIECKNCAESCKECIAACKKVAA